ncbi:hypothetical protein AB5I41_13435 [Sphingomonas sp. MMS24-JH45]
MGDWVRAFFQASAGDYRDDVVAETADISFGEAWVEPYASDGRGTNVVVRSRARDGRAGPRRDRPRPPRTGARRRRLRPRDAGGGVPPSPGGAGVAAGDLPAQAAIRKRAAPSCRRARVAPPAPAYRTRRHIAR